jgi:hypothetical protein
MLAIADAKTGKICGLPLSGKGPGLYVPMDPMSDVEIDFRLDTSLMVLRNACHEGRTECGVSCFNFNDGQFVLLKRILVDLTKAEERR